MPPTGLGFLAAPRLSFGGLGIGNECAHHAPTPATRGADVGLPYPTAIASAVKKRSHVKSIQVKSSQVKSLCQKSFFSSVKSIEPNLNHGQDTRANRTRNTTRSSTRNHTQNSNQVCMSLRSAVEAPTCISLNEYMYVPRFLTPNPPDSVEVCRSASGVRAVTGRTPDRMFACWDFVVGARRGRSGAAGAGAGLDSRASLDHAPRSSSGTRCTGHTDARADVYRFDF